MRAFIQRGFTLIEMMIALVIVALLVLLAAPMYGEMLANTEIRNASENILMGLRTAQGEAIKLNAPAKFTLDSTGWNVYVTSPDTNDFDATAWRSYFFNEGARRAVVTPSGEVTFNGLGQIVQNVDGAAILTKVDVTSSSGISNLRALRVLVGTGAVGAGMKMCDPSYATDDPVGCPPST